MEISPTLRFPFFIIDCAAVCETCSVICFLFLSVLVSFAYFCGYYLNFQIVSIIFYVPLTISLELNESLKTFSFVVVSYFPVTHHVCPKLIS